MSAAVSQRTHRRREQQAALLWKRTFRLSVLAAGGSQSTAKEVCVRCLSQGWHRVSNQHTAQTELSLPSVHTQRTARPPLPRRRGDAGGLWGENVAGCLHGSSALQWIWHVRPAPASFCTPLAKPDSLLPGLATCLPRWQRRRHALADYWSVRWRRPRILFFSFFFSFSSFFSFFFYHSVKVFMRTTSSTGTYHLFIYVFIYSALVLRQCQ